MAWIVGRVAEWLAGNVVGRMVGFVAGWMVGRAAGSGCGGWFVDVYRFVEDVDKSNGRCMYCESACCQGDSTALVGSVSTLVVLAVFSPSSSKRTPSFR